MSIQKNLDVNTSNLTNDVITVTKSADKSQVSAGDTIFIETIVVNNTAEEMYDIDILDNVSDGAVFKEGSFKYDGVHYDDFDPTLGFSIGGPLSASGGTVTYSYELVCNDNLEGITEITLDTIASVEVAGRYEDFYSNELIFAVLNLVNDVVVEKLASTTAVRAGDEISYVVTISNNGSLKNTDVHFVDLLPQGVTFVENSVKIDGVEKAGFNPSGFDLDDLTAGKVVKVEYKVKVDS